jgi:hypothetical protein
MASSKINETRNIPVEFMACRSFQHAWDFTTVKHDGGLLVQGLRCLRCPTIKYVKLDSRTGLRTGSARYDYPDNYRVSGGQLTIDEIAACRLAEVKSHLGSRRGRRLRSV